MKVFVLIIGFIILSLNGLYSQKTIKEYERDGDAYFKSGRYFPAVESYRNALRFDTTNTAIAYKYAEALSKSLNYCKAVKWYESVIVHTDSFTYPLCLYKLAVARKNCGDYQRAFSDFNTVLKYSDSIPQLSNLKEIIKHDIKSVNFALQHKNDTIIYSIEHLPAPVNTPFSEFNPVEIPGGKLVFSSYKTTFTDSFQNIFSQTYFSRIVVARQTETGWKEPEEFGNKINSGRWFTANICFSHRYRTIYFTRCYETDGLVGRCIIYKSQKKKGKWTKAEKLPAIINKPSTSSTQPFLAEGDKYDILFFVSNRKGGFGKNDIWYSILKDGEFQEPSNLGPAINTKGNEMTPYYDIKTNTLYFSSDWHEGFGGFDIFKSHGGFNQWEKPVNMGIPVNSENNDLYFTPGRSGNDAYLSSNRIGSFYHKGSTYCCSDIYYVTMEKKSKTPVPVDSTAIPELTTEQKIKKILPITLYFDNDIPDPGSISDTTTANYKSLLDKYFEQKAKYRRQYSKGLTGEAKANAVDTINDFFDSYVGAGFKDLEMLTQLLKTELDSGKKVKIKVRGYASPLNTAEYNYHLSKRRIASLINYLLTVDSGRFEPYFNATAPNGGSLKIYQDPRGDRNAATYVSDNPNDKRNSVYSKAAALERRIQITRYSTGEDEDTDFELPVISFKTDTFYAGTVIINNTKTGIINFRNTGSSELKINKLECNEPFVQFQMKSATTKPGDNGTIYYQLKTKNLESGKYNCILTIHSNAKTRKIIMVFEVKRI